MNSLIEAGQSPPLFINYFNDAALSIFTFALAARPPLLAFIVELVYLIFAIVVPMLLFLHSDCLRAVWLQGKLRIILQSSIVQFGLDDACNDTVYRLVCCPWHFISDLLSQLVSKLGGFFFFLSNPLMDFI